MPIGGGKSFLDKTWAPTFEEIRYKSNNTNITIPYGKQIIDVEAKGGDSGAPFTQPSEINYTATEVPSQINYSQVTNPSTVNYGNQFNAAYQGKGFYNLAPYNYVPYSSTPVFSQIGPSLWSSTRNWSVGPTVYNPGGWVSFFNYVPASFNWTNFFTDSQINWETTTNPSTINYTAQTYDAVYTVAQPGQDTTIVLGGNAPTIIAPGAVAPNFGFAPATATITYAKIIDPGQIDSIDGTSVSNYVGAAGLTNYSGSAGDGYAIVKYVA